MTELTTGIEVPEKDIQARRVSRAGPENPEFPPLLRVHTGESAPPPPYIRVRYRDRWFWIAADDLESKRTFTLLMFFFSLAESPGGTAAPIVTISAGS